MGDDDGGAAIHHGAHGLADLVLLRRVHGAGGVVEHQHARVRHDGAGKCDPLPLTSAERVAALTQQRVVAIGKFEDEVVRPGQARSRFDVALRCIRASEGDVRSDGVVEQERVFEHDAHLATQVAQRQVAYVHPIEPHGTCLRVVEADEQPSHRALSPTGAAHQRHRGTRRNAEIEVAQHRRLGGVAEGDVVELHRAHCVAVGQHCGRGRVGHRRCRRQHLVHAQQCCRSALAECHRHAEVPERKDQQADVLHEFQHLATGHGAAEHTMTTDGQHGQETEVRQQVQCGQE